MEIFQKSRTCCFFGHRSITVTPDLTRRIRKIILDLIHTNCADTFLFGSKSDFNTLCYEIVTKLKEEYSHLKRIYVRAEYPLINEDYANYLLRFYEDSYFPEQIINSGRAVYVERNYEMINKSRYCIIYYDEKYPLENNGTKKAYNYAKRKQLIIKNVFNGGETSKFD